MSEHHDAHGHKLFDPEMFNDPEFKFYNSHDRNRDLRMAAMSGWKVCMRCGAIEVGLKKPCTNSIAWMRYLLDKYSICVDTGHMVHLSTRELKSPYNKYFELTGTEK